ncbi:hypothetical protein OE88DRAFT_1669402 [Heliocybe sulcata]|uniref:Uncharacterized protein n=1 Tax=Heliocybe sulcata TaxID=5364 RepID=A0A5C3ML14_9AGAM|nr:hypothetical protein OE88DRAFT_1669402 [Heliocybe sulcata]
MPSRKLSPLLATTRTCSASMLYNSLKSYWKNVARNFLPFNAPRHSHSWRHLQGPQPRLPCYPEFEECFYSVLDCASALSSLGKSEEACKAYRVMCDRGRTIGKMARRWWPRRIIGFVRDMVPPSPGR